MASFQDQLKAFEVKAKGLSHAVTAESIIQLGEDIIADTPIKSGRAKSNWNYATETPDPHTTLATNIRTLNGIEDMPKRAADFIHYISNGLPYGPSLERGSSGQAPQGMVGLNVLRWDQIVAGVAGRLASGGSASILQGGALS